MKAAKAIGEHIYIAGAVEKRIFKKLVAYNHECRFAYETRNYCYYTPFGELDETRGEMTRIPLNQVNCLEPDSIRIIGCAE